MPTYEYRCPDGHLFEVFKSITAPAPAGCTVCGKGPVEIVLHPVPVHFKGSGFYSTDYGRRGARKPEASKDGDAGSADKAAKEPTVEKKAAEA